MAMKVDEKNVHVVALRVGEGKLTDLIAKRRAKEDELSEATIRYLDRRRSQQRSVIELEAEALLSGEPMKAGANTADFEKLQREIDVLSEAIAQHSQLLDGLRNKYSVAICKANYAAYVAIEKRIAAAVRELAAANEAEALFFRELQDVGCTAIQFRPMRVGAAGLASDDQSVASFHRKEVATYCPKALQ
jgi:hypothetical protein